MILSRTGLSINALIIFYSVFIASCSSPNGNKTDVVVADTSSRVVTEVVNEPASGISQDSLAFFEDLSHEDKSKRDETFKKVNELFRAHGKTLPNQASYSTLKYYEAYPAELIDRLRTVDKTVYDSWAYYIGSELIFSAPEDEMLFATQKLQNITESCYDCSAKDKSDRAKFHEAVMVVVTEKMKAL